MTSAPESSASLKQKALAHWDLLNKLAHKRFSRSVDAEEAALYVLDAMEKDDWKRLQKFHGKTEFTAFFATVSWRLLEDFSRKKFGRHTPPKWIKEADGIWLLLYRLLCMERFAYPEAVQLAQQKVNRGIKVIESVAEQILGNVTGCGTPDRADTLFNEEDIVQGSCSSDKSTVAEKREVDLLLLAIGIEVFDGKQDVEITNSLKKLLQHKIKLSSSDRLLLKLCFQEELSATLAGEMLGFNRFQAHGRIRRALARIRKQFQDAGCEQELRLLLK